MGTQEPEREGRHGNGFWSATELPDREVGKSVLARTGSKRLLERCKGSQKLTILGNDKPTGVLLCPRLGVFGEVGELALQFRPSKFPLRR